MALVACSAQIHAQGREPRPSRMLKKWDGQPISPREITPFQHFRDGEIGVSPVFQRSPSLFFENKVKPILCEHCIMCHNDDLKNGNVSFLHREGLVAKGTKRATIFPGKPEQSILIQVIRQEGDVTMPPGSKLRAQDIGTLTKWVRLGAPWGSKPVSCGKSH
jgi:hypothetical protein